MAASTSKSAVSENAFQIIKHPKGKPLKSGEKRIVLNVFNKLMHENPTCLVNDVVKLTSEFTGVSEWSIACARKEMKETGVLRTPGKKRKKRRPELEKADDFVKCAIRSKAIMNHLH